MIPARGAGSAAAAGVIARLGRAADRRGRGSPLSTGGWGSFDTALLESLLSIGIAPERARAVVDSFDCSRPRPRRPRRCSAR
jgi:hypothetical protein